jgi:hypothetical protein
MVGPLDQLKTVVPAKKRTQLDPHRPRPVQVGLTIVFVLVAGNEVTSW